MFSRGIGQVFFSPGRDKISALNPAKLLDAIRSYAKQLRTTNENNSKKKLELGAKVKHFHKKGLEMARQP